MVEPANSSPRPERSNLRARVVTGALLGTATLAAILLLPTWAWSLPVALAIAAGAWEWSALARLTGPVRWLFTLIMPALGLAMFFLATDWGNAATTGIAAAFWLLLAPVWLWRGWGMPGGLAGALLGAVLLVPTAHAALALHAQSPWLLLAALMVAVIADTAAYFSGRRFGRHKLAPRISPGKTREGALGGALAVLLYAAATGFLGFDCAPDCLSRLLIAALFLFIASVLGDLFESHAKRQAGIKDSGNLLPGHGGVLDRIDSLTAVLPLALLFFLLWT